VKNPTYIGRFDAEAWAAAKLNHSNIVHVYSIGTLDGLKFIAMEYVQGTNLKEYLAKKGPLEMALGLSILKQSALAIGAAGEIGLIHRDIKPENLLLTKKGQVKVADFGLCRDSEGGDMHLTQPGVTMGTPMYMSPEQVQGHTCDHRSDLYSLGITAYHMFTGSPPFKADTPFALALKHLKDTAVSPRVLRPEIPIDLERIVLKLIEKQPGDRYQSAAELLRDLAKLRETMQTQTISQPIDIKGRPSGVSRSSISTATLSRPSSFFETLAAIPRPQLGLSNWQVVGLFGLCLIAGGAVGWSRRPADLLSVGATEPAASAPALWMVRDWSAIPRQATAEAQYRFAQSKVTEDQREAAWLAVPGYFPTEHQWSTRAYTQYARLLFRSRDAERLELLGKELARAADRSSDQILAPVVRGAVLALRHEYSGVVKEMEPRNEMLEPGEVELSLEVVMHALQAARLDTTSAVAQALLGIQVKIIGKLLLIESIDYPDHASRSALAPVSSPVKFDHRRSSLAWRS
jgi:hypothetical protein